MKQFLTIALTCFPLLCFGAPTYTTYFNNTHTYTNATIAGTNFAGRGVFTNGITAGASTFTGAVTVPAGTVGAPGLVVGDADTGLFQSAGFLRSAVDGTESLRLHATSLQSVGYLQGTSLRLHETAFSGSSRAILTTDGVDNTLALRNGTSAQTFNVYNTYTDASNYERGVFQWTSNTLRVGTDNLGTGTSRNLQFYTKGAGIIQFAINNGVVWNINGSGHLLAQTDNTYDIGASGATRPRNVYVAGTATIGGNVVASGTVQAGSAGEINWGGRSTMRSPSDGIITLINDPESDFNRLQFGGTTASFPALKRSSTEIQVRLADDSADAPLKSGQLSNTGIRVMTPSSLQTLAAANALLANATKVRVVGSGGAVTLTSTPTIADGSDGQYVMIQGTDDTNTLTVQDQGSLASSNLELGAATRVLGAGDVLVLTFDSTASVWYEVSFANN